MKRKHDRRPLWLLIFLSGAAGLVYQVVWQRYLGILLGAQAKATAAVLAIFLGGISVGYAWFGNWSRQTRRNLLIAYTLVEAGLAVWGWCFPFLFHGVFRLVGRLYGLWGVDNLAIDILASAVLIGPPTVLMGGTLPLLTQSLSEDVQESSRTHASIYGFNTVGACLGSFLTGYWLLPMTSLPIACSVAGGLNALVAAVMYVGYARHVSPPIPAEEASAAEPVAPMTAERATSPLYLIGFLSGLYLITLETILVRLMGLSTGSSEYNFTLILSIFVFGLGIGSLLVRRIDQYSESRLFWNQLTVAATLLLLYLSADSWPYWVHRVRVVFRDQPENFYLYQFALGGFFLFLLAIPIGFCGLTMPLCFHLAKDRRETLGLRVGQLYAVNTVGCVLGALCGGYLALNYFDLDQLFKGCVIASLLSAGAAGVLYLRKAQADLFDTIGGGAIFGLVTVGVVVAPRFAKEMFIQPFRQQNVVPNVTYSGRQAFGRHLGSASRYLFYKDGPNSTVGVGVTSIEGVERSRTIFVNGKSDGNTRGDALTMALTAHIPGVLSPKLERACVLGFGTGMTVGGLASYRENQSVDVVEISGTVLEAAPYFDSYDGAASQSPKVHFHQMDAFRFLNGSQHGFDVIVSEPSNPWVAGVENLYTAEFYETVRRHLNPDGVFVQWVQAYSFNDPLFKLVLRTITNRFPNVSIFQMLEHDIALVAWPHELSLDELKAAEARWRGNPDVQRQLEAIGIHRFEGLLAYELVPPALTRLLPEAGPVNRLESPRLSHGAARAFFAGASAHVHAMRRGLKEYYPLVQQLLLTRFLAGEPMSSELADDLRTTFCDSPPHRSNILCEEALVMSKWLSPQTPYEREYGDLLTPASTRDIASLLTPLSPRKFSRGDLMAIQHGFDFFKTYRSAIAPLPIFPIVQKLNVCLQSVGREEGLYGDCLLQKAAVLEIAAPQDPDFNRTVKAFLHWFDQLPREHEDYERFRKADEILRPALNG